MNFINPYQIMGIDPNKPDLQKLKKTYYRWALLCHPDKGGKKEDMTTIHNCYLWIKNQFENCKEQKTYEELETEFEIFCKTQEEHPPSFCEIWKTSDEYEKLQKFNKQFESTKKISNSNFNNFQDGGYGKFMDVSEYTNNEKNIKTLTKPINPEIIKKPNVNFTGELIIYKEPVAKPSGYGNHHRYDIEKVNDYSHQLTKTETYDYKKAFTKNKNSLNNEIFLQERSKTIEELIKKRNTFINNYHTEQKKTSIGVNK